MAIAPVHPQEVGLAHHEVADEGLHDIVFLPIRDAADLEKRLAIAPVQHKLRVLERAAGVVPDGPVHGDVHHGGHCRELEPHVVVRVAEEVGREAGRRVGAAGRGLVVGELPGRAAKIGHVLEQHRLGAVVVGGRSEQCAHCGAAK